MTKPLASLSLDLDNKWSYLKVRGDQRWQDLPSYFDTVVPRILSALDLVGVKATVFVVGQDAKLEKNRQPLQSIAAAGHEIANHSFHHEPWLHLYSEQQIAEELELAEDAIREVTGAETRGFRGPGFSISDQVLRELASRGYRYDATSFPTFLGPLARLFYFFRTRLNRRQREDRKELFGRFRDGFQTLRPHVWRSSDAHLLTRIPVTTMPVLRFPIHASYLMYLREFSPGLAMAYFRTALMLCRRLKIEPSFLLHPLEFLGSDDDQDLQFFPGMKSSSDVKLAFVSALLELYTNQFAVVTMEEHAAASSGNPIQQMDESSLPELAQLDEREPALSAAGRESR
ncbi:MAG: polysaccharide deacetylase family protein [Planctomycetota bacterium]